MFSFLGVGRDVKGSQATGLGAVGNPTEHRADRRFLYRRLIFPTVTRSHSGFRNHCEDTRRDDENSIREALSTTLEKYETTMKVSLAGKNEEDGPASECHQHHNDI